MSRKSAYAHKARDRAFAAAWPAAKAAAKRHSGPALSLSKGDKVEEVHAPPVSTGQGDALPSRQDCERSFVGLMTTLRESPSLAPAATAQ